MTDFLCEDSFSESMSPGNKREVQFLLFQLDLKLKSPNAEGDTSGYTTNGEWALIGTVTENPSTSFR